MTTASDVDARPALPWRLWAAACAVGVDPGLDRDHLKRLVLTNQIGVLVVAITVTYTAMFGALGMMPCFWLNLSFVFYYLIALFGLHALRFYRAAKLLFLCGGNLHLFLYPFLLGRECGIGLILFAGSVVAFVIVAWDEKWIAVIACALSATLYVATHFVYMDPPMLVLTEVAQAALYWFSVVGTFALLIGPVAYFYIANERAERLLAEERETSERLLLNILPEPIAKRLKEAHGSIADGFGQVTVLFADIVNFTVMSDERPPEEVVAMLNEVFSAFDRLTETHGLEKIKTIGDAYMVAGGLPLPRADHASAVAAMALDMKAEVADFARRNGRELSIRIGINSGPVVAGVIGEKKFIYDLWGDTVNTASRMESHGLSDRIHITKETADQLDDRFVLEPRGPISVKGKGEMSTWFLVGMNGSPASAPPTS